MLKQVPEVVRWSCLQVHFRGTIVAASSVAMTYQTINPYNGDTTATFQQLNDTELESAIATAAKCFAAWKATPFATRAKVLHVAATIFRAQVDTFAKLMTLEMGKRIDEARGEVKLCADIFDYYAEHGERFLMPTDLHPSNGEATAVNVPIGVLFGVQPWNFPYYQLARFAAPNLMAGNVVMVKHAANVPQCAQAFAKLWIDAGAPSGAYTNLMISHEQVLQVIDDVRIRGVALTGGVEGAKPVAVRAAQNLKKSTMELGGSDAFIVLDDADIAKTVRWAVWAKMNNMGQCCVAGKRFIVEEAVADEFFARFKEALQVFQPGDPMDPKTNLAPMSSEAALTALLAQVKQAVAAGAVVELGGERIDRPGSFMQPTILGSIAPSNPAFHQEFFGPVALCFRVKDEQAAIELANDSNYGLGGSVFTNDAARGRRVADQIDTGMVFINHPTWTSPELPFGGAKQSGYGRELSSVGILEFVNHKLIRTSSVDDAA